MPETLAATAGASPQPGLFGTGRRQSGAAPPSASPIGSRRITVRAGTDPAGPHGIGSTGPDIALGGKAPDHSPRGALTGAATPPGTAVGGTRGPRPARMAGRAGALFAARDESTGEALFDEFYRASRTSIGRALALAIGDVDLATEATDEAMARAFERWSVVSRLDRPEGWVYRVGLNWSLSVLRRRRRSPHRLYEPPTVDGPQPSDAAVGEALGALDVRHRSVVVCRFLLGWSVADTATALRVREGTVKSRLHRAVKQLEQRLGHLRVLEEES